LNNILNALKETGYLLIIEDKLLPKGEKIGEIGFIIMDSESLMKLFGLKEKPLSFVETNKSDRILCSLIQKDKVKQVTESRIINALNILQLNSLNKLKELRNMPNMNMNISFGRMSGFYSQQYINSTLALEYFTND
jgi:hypothetical protein